MARVRQMKLTQYLEPTPQLPPPPVFTAPQDTVGISVFSLGGAMSTGLA